MKLKDYISESFNKEYGYRVKIAADCNADHLTQLENCLQKYNLVSATAWKRSPIEENPMEFVRRKGVKFTSEICSSDVILKYPVNERILEVWLSVNMNLNHDRVLVYGVKEPRKAEAEMASERVENDKGREVRQEDALLNNENQEHYEFQNADLDEDLSLFGEEYNQKFLAELQKLRDEKGADYFRCYPTKDQLMGDDLRTMWNDLHNGTNMGRGNENKEVDVISQSSRRN